MFPIIEMYLFDEDIAYSYIFGSKEPFVICIIMAVSSLLDASEMKIVQIKRSLFFASIILLLSSSLLYMIALIHDRFSELQTKLDKSDIANTSVIFLVISISVALFVRIMSRAEYSVDT
jgi:hypothetical protein